MREETTNFWGDDVKAQSDMNHNLFLLPIGRKEGSGEKFYR